MSRTFRLLGMLLILLLAACRGVSAPEPKLTASPSATAPLPTRSVPTSLPEPTQSLAPSPEATAYGPQVIRPENASQVVPIRRLGKGSIQSHPFYAPEGMPVSSPDALWIAIPTTAGIYIYDASSLEELRMIPVGTGFMAFSPDGSLLAVIRCLPCPVTGCGFHQTELMWW